MEILRFAQDHKRKSESVCGGSRRGGLNAGDLSQRCVVDGVALFAPSIEAALQRTNLLDSLFAQQDSELRAGRFVGAGAVEDDLAIAREFVVFLAQLLGINAKRARNRFR